MRVAKRATGQQQGPPRVEARPPSLGTADRVGTRAPQPPAVARCLPLEGPVRNSLLAGPPNPVARPDTPTRQAEQVDEATEGPAWALAAGRERRFRVEAVAPR